MTHAAETGPRERGFVIMYAVILIAFLGILATSLLPNSSSAIDVVAMQKYRMLSRYAADSGIEYGIAVIDSELANDCTPVSAVGHSSPWCDPAYQAPTTHLGFLDPANNATEVTQTNNAVHPLVPDGTAGEANSWLLPITLSTPSNDVEIVGSRVVSEAILNLQPAFNFTNVHDRIMGGQDAVFCLRSRGLIRQGPIPTTGPALSPPPPANAMYLIAQSVHFLKFRISMRTCSGRPKVERLVYDTLSGASFDRGAVPANGWTKFPAGILPH